jgi:hypothetical protein
MRKIALLLVLVLAASSLSFAQTKKPAPKPAPKTAPTAPARTATAPAAESRFTISPKLSYVGYLGIGCEFSPITKITPDIDLMGEINWDFWASSGGNGYLYGELNVVYNAKPFELQGQQAPLKPYVGGGLIYGLPMGNSIWGTTFGGGIGFGIFGGVTGQLDPYTWYAQLKFANGPITWRIPGAGIIPDQTGSWNALGAGMEFGVRFPL